MGTTMENANGRITDIENVIVKLKESINDLYTLMLWYKPIPEHKRAVYMSHDYLISSVCNYYNTNLGELVTRRRQSKWVRRRKITARLLYIYTDRTLNQVAEILGYSNHTSVLHHIKKANEELSPDFYGNDDFKKEYSQLVNHLKLQDYDKETDELRFEA